MFPWKYDVIHSARCVPRQFEYHPNYEDVVLFGGYNGDCGIINTRSRTVKPLGAFGGEVEDDSILGIKWFHCHPDRFIIGSAAGIITCAKADVWDDSPDNVEKLQTYPLFRRLSSVHLNCDNTKLIVSGNTKNVAIFDTTTASLITETPPIHAESINISRFSNLSPHVFATCSFDSTVKLWDARVPMTITAPVYTITTPRSLVMINFSPNDTFLLSSGVDNEVNEYLVADGRHHLRYDVPKRGSDINFTRAYYSASGSYVLTGGCEESCVHMLCGSTGSMIMTVPLFPESEFPSVYVQSLRTCPSNESKFSVLVNDKLLPYRQLIHVDFRENRSGEEARASEDGLRASDSTPTPPPPPIHVTTGELAGTMLIPSCLPDEAVVQLPPPETYLLELDVMWRIRRSIDRNASAKRGWMDGVVYLCHTLNNEKVSMNKGDEEKGDITDRSETIGVMRTGLYGTTWIGNSFSLPFHVVVAIARCPVLYRCISIPDCSRIGSSDELYIDLSPILSGFSRLEAEGFFATIRYIYSTTIDFNGIVQFCHENRFDKSIFSDSLIGKLSPSIGDNLLCHLLAGHVIEFLGCMYKSAVVLELYELISHLDCLLGTLIRLHSVQHIITIASTNSRVHLSNLCFTFMAAHLEILYISSLELVRSAVELISAPNFQGAQSSRSAVLAVGLLRAFKEVEIPNLLWKSKFASCVIDGADLHGLLNCEALLCPKYLKDESVFGNNDHLWRYCLRCAYEMLLMHDGGGDGIDDDDATFHDFLGSASSSQFTSSPRSEMVLHSEVDEDLRFMCRINDTDAHSHGLEKLMIGTGPDAKHQVEVPKPPSPYVRSPSERCKTNEVPSMFDHASLIVLDKIMLVVGGRNEHKMYYCDFLFTFFPESKKWSVTQAYGSIPALQGTFIVVPLQRTNIRHLLFIVDKYGLWSFHVLDCLTMNWTQIKLTGDDLVNIDVNSKSIMKRHRSCAQPVYAAEDAPGLDSSEIRCTHIVIFGGYCFDSQLTRNDLWVLKLIPEEISLTSRTEQFTSIHSTCANMKLPQIGSYADALTRVHCNDVELSLTIARTSVLGTPASPHWGSTSAIVWSTPDCDPSTARMVLYGGVGPAVDNELYCLRCGNPNLVAWENVITSGQFPGIRYGHSMVAASHNTILVHGGLQLDGQFRFNSPDSESIFVIHLDAANGVNVHFRWSEMIRRCPVSITPRCRHTAVYWKRMNEDLPATPSLLIFGGVDTENGMYNENLVDDGLVGVELLSLSDTTWAVAPDDEDDDDQQYLVLFNCTSRLLRKPYSIHNDMKSLLNNLAHFDMAVKLDIDCIQYDLERIGLLSMNDESGTRKGDATPVLPGHSVIMALRCPLIAGAFNFPILSALFRNSNDPEALSSEEEPLDFPFHKYVPALQTLEQISGELLIDMGDVARFGGLKNMMTVLNYLYCGTAELTPDTVMFYLHAADEYSIRPLFTQCESYLIRYLDPLNACEILAAAEAYIDKLTTLKTVALNMIIVGIEHNSFDQSELDMLSHPIRREIDFLQLRRAESRRRRGEIPST